MSLFFTIGRTDPTIQITPEQDQFIDKLANYYSKLMLSFHPEEIENSFTLKIYTNAFFQHSL